MGSEPYDSNRNVFGDNHVVAAYVGATELMADEVVHFKRYIEPGARILDLGVGTGRTTPALAAIASKYVGIDYAAAMIEQAHLLHPHADLRVGDASDLSDFADSSFDVVVFSYNGLDYLHPDDRRGRCLDEIHRVIREGGRFLFARHNPRAIFDPLAGDRKLPRRLATQAYIGARRARRLVPTAAFWSGMGYVREPARGGLVHHMATPEAAAVELLRHGFVVVDTLSARSTRRRSILTTPWFSYAAVAE